MAHFPQRNIGSCYRRASANAEVAAAIRTPIRHGPGIRNLASLHAPTVPAAALTSPDGLLKPALGGRIVWEYSDDLENIDAFAVRFPWGFSRRCHTLFVPELAGYVK